MSTTNEDISKGKRTDSNSDKPKKNTESIESDDNRKQRADKGQKESDKSNESNDKSGSDRDSDQKSDDKPRKGGEEDKSGKDKDVCKTKKPVDDFRNLRFETQSREVFDFYVKMVLWKGTKKKSNLHIITNQTDDDVSHVKMFYHDPEDKDRDKFPQWHFYRIRIPALMLFILNVPEDKCDHVDYHRHQSGHIVNRYRPQIATHLMANSRCQTLHVSDTSWVYEDNKRQYTVSAQKSLSCVYPCMSQKGDQRELILGLGFVDSQSGVNHQRSYHRYPGIIHKSLNVFDMMEKFLGTGKEEMYKPSNEKLFPVEGKQVSALALYVCRGARLVVSDNTSKETEDECCRSLFQSGSLVVVRTFTSFSLNVKNKDRQLMEGDMNFKNFLETYSYPDLSESKLGERETQAKTEKNSLMCEQDKKVLFLGGIESQHNSATWKLTIRQCPTKEEDHFSTLDIPEGGFFEDISTWDMGFQLIRARHQYERAFDSCLERDDGKHLADLPFQVPEDQYIYRRILGINESRPMIIKVNYEKLDLKGNNYVMASHEKDRDLRRYLALMGHHMPSQNNLPYDRLWTHTEEFIHPLVRGVNDVPPQVLPILPPPPLYPPVLERVSKERYRMKYLKKEDKVELAGSGGQLPDFNHLEFVLSGRKTGPKYELICVPIKGNFWIPAVDQNDCYEYRIGIDYHSYHKWKIPESISQAYLPIEMKALVLCERDHINEIKQLSGYHQSFE